MRIGLIGNGYWARVTHAEGLAAEPSVTLTGLWGRNAERSEVLATEFGITAYQRVEDLFDDVEAVSFSVPPQVQSELALRAATLGKHLLLEKPIAVSVQAADRLAAAVDEAGVASVVFFTSRFDDAQRAWLDEMATRPGWDGGSGQLLGAAFAEGSPFDTPWRHDKGGLWDLGPHALAIITAALGPVEQLAAMAGPRDLVQLSLRHHSGACSSYALSIQTPVAATHNGLTIWGEPGRFELPAGPSDPAAALATAARELAVQAGRPDPSHPCDVRFGRRVVELLAEAERQLGL